MRADGTVGRSMKPYIIDLGSGNGTFLNYPATEILRTVLKDITASLTSNGNSPGIQMGASSKLYFLDLSFLLIRGRITLAIIASIQAFTPACSRGSCNSKTHQQQLQPGYDIVATAATDTHFAYAHVLCV
ncbi:hypothetical protein STEG23_020053 [Scotinomys teguina]